MHLALNHSISSRACSCIEHFTTTVVAPPHPLILPTYLSVGIVSSSRRGCCCMRHGLQQHSVVLRSCCQIETHSDALL